MAGVGCSDEEAILNVVVATEGARLGVLCSGGDANEPLCLICNEGGFLSTTSCLTIDIRIDFLPSGSAAGAWLVERWKSSSECTCSIDDAALVTLPFLTSGLRLNSSSLVGESTTTALDDLATVVTSFGEAWSLSENSTDEDGDATSCVGAGERYTMLAFNGGGSGALDAVTVEPFFASEVGLRTLAPLNKVLHRLVRTARVRDHESSGLLVVVPAFRVEDGAGEEQQ